MIGRHQQFPLLRGSRGRPAVCVGAIFVSLGLLLITACSGLKQPAPMIGFYTLEYDPPLTRSQPAQAPPASPHVLQIDRFQSAPPYRTSRMYYREGAYHLQPYVYHKWIAPPGEMVAFLLARNFQSAPCLQAVTAPHDGTESTHSLRGVVNDFYEQDDTDQWSAVLSVTITLIDEHRRTNLGNGILFQRSYRKVEPSKRKNPQALADAMSRALADVATQIMADICHLL